MKRQVQETGIRKWYGDDLTSLQSEMFDAFESYLKPYGNMILEGCTIAKHHDRWTVSAGMVALYDLTGSEYRVCRFLQEDVVNAHTQVYFVLESVESKREYKTGGSKVVQREYRAKLTTVRPNGSNYIIIHRDSANITYRDAIQDSSHRFVTENQINAWNQHKDNQNNPHNVTKSQVGLSNIPNKISDRTDLDDSGSLAT